MAGHVALDRDIVPGWGAGRSLENREFCRARCSGVGRTHVEAVNAGAGEPKSPFVERHRAALVMASVLVVLAVGAWLAYFFRPGPDLRPPMFNWYTTDDGASWFQDDAERVPP